MKRMVFGFVVSAMLAAPSLKGQSTAQQAAAQSPSAAKPDLASRVPAPRPEDVSSIEGMLHAVYDVISGPAGERDWSRFRSLFVPEGRLTSAVKRPNSTAPVRLLTVDDYVTGAGGYFAKNGFFESSIVNHVERFGNVAQVFSSYESRHAAEEKPFTRGINSFQLFYDGSRWWILSILWDEESGDNPLPKDFSVKAPANPK